MSEILWALFGIVASIVWAEFTEWTPWLAKRILNAAIRKVPESQRERVSEELAGLLDDVPGKLWKLWTASSLWWGFSRESLRNNFREDVLDATQRAIDILSAIVFFIIFFPLYSLVYVAVRMTSPGPAHFEQTRIGKHGKSFKFYKFRTMVCNSDEVLEKYLIENKEARLEWDQFQRLSHDPRITPVGAFIRKLSLDELPQFFNVLKGDMSIVGPRPCMERQRKLYGKHWISYCKVRPGLTGLWQTGERNLVSFAQRVALDVEYVKNRSLWMNIVILLKTVKTVFIYDDQK